MRRQKKISLDTARLYLRVLDDSSGQRDCCLYFSLSIARSLGSHVIGVFCCPCSISTHSQVKPCSRRTSALQHIDALDTHARLSCYPKSASDHLPLWMNCEFSPGRQALNALLIPRIMTHVAKHPRIPIKQFQWLRREKILRFTENIIPFLTTTIAIDLPRTRTRGKVTRKIQQYCNRPISHHL